MPVINRYFKREVQTPNHTLLGRANHRLGSHATLGKKIWDQQAAIGLVIGPLSVKRLRSLVQGGEHQHLRSLLGWISDSRCDCQVTLVYEDGIGTVTTLAAQLIKPIAWVLAVG